MPAGYRKFGGKLYEKEQTVEEVGTGDEQLWYLVNWRALHSSLCGLLYLEKCSGS